MKRILQFAIAIFALVLWSSLASAQLQTNGKNIETGGGEILTNDGLIDAGNGKVKAKFLEIGVIGGNINAKGNDFYMDGGNFSTQGGKITVEGNQLVMKNSAQMVLENGSNIEVQGGKIRFNDNSIGLEFVGGATAGSIFGVKDVTASGTIQGDFVTATTTCCSSDSRFKSQICDLAKPLDLIKQVRGVRFNWNQTDFPEKNFSSLRQIGFIAQELETVFPEFVHQDAEGFKAVEYGKMTAVLVEAVKEQQTIIERQQQELNQLKAQLDKVSELNDAYAQIVSLLEKLEGSEAKAITDTN